MGQPAGSIAVEELDIDADFWDGEPAEIDEVYFRAFPYLGPGGLWRNSTVQHGMNRIITDVLGKYGIRSTKLPSPQHGGGVDAIWELVKDLLLHFKFIVAGFTVARYAFTRLMNFRKFDSEPDRPQLRLHLEIRTDEEYLEASSQYVIDRMIILGKLADEIAEKLQLEYPIYQINPYLVAVIRGSSYHVYVDYRRCSEQQKSTIVKRLRKLKIARYRSINIAAARFGSLREQTSQWELDSEERVINDKAKTRYRWF